MKEKRKQFGTRYLVNEEDVYTQNAWDDVQWSPEQEAEALKKIAHQKEAPVSIDEAKELLENTAAQWEQFYETHGTKFFMDRNWLLTEFPEINTNERVGR